MTIKVPISTHDRLRREAFHRTEAGDGRSITISDVVREAIEITLPRRRGAK